MSIIARQSPDIVPPQRKRELLRALFKGVAMGIEVTLLLLSPVLAYALLVAHERHDRDLGSLMDNPAAMLVAGLLSAAVVLWIRLPFTIHHALQRPISPGPSTRILARDH